MAMGASSLDSCERGGVACRCGDSPPGQGPSQNEIGRDSIEKSQRNRQGFCPGSGRLTQAGSVIRMGPYVQASPASASVPMPLASMAELTPEEKDAISHRGRAARAFLTWLEEHRG